MKFNKAILIFVLSLYLAGVSLAQTPRGRKPSSLGEIFTSSYKQHPRYRGIVGHWIMNDRGGDVVRDISGFGQDGSFNNMDPATDWIIGQFGGGLDFDGTNDRIILDALQNTFGAGAESISLWFMATGPSNTFLFGDDGGGPFLQILAGASDLVRYTEDGTTFCGTTSGSIATTDVWYHVVATNPGDGTGKMYLNGKEDSFDTSCTNGTGDTLFNIGADTTGGSRHTGQIDDVRLYNRVLTAAEVQSLYVDPYLEFRAPFPSVRSIPAVASTAGRGPVVY